MSTTTPAIDQAELLARCNGKLSLLVRLARIYQEQTPRLLDDLQAALQRSDAPAAEHAAHTLKGSLAQLGAAAAADLARQIESSAASGALSGLELPLKQLQQQADSIQQTLNELTKS